MFRDKFANNLGISQARKELVYLDICRSVTLEDVSYWIQVLFAAGIATLGLVLNSPAVIIGAMLISPLMGGMAENGQRKFVDAADFRAISCIQSNQKKIRNRN